MLALILFAQAQAQILAPGCETVGTEVLCPPANVSDPYYGGAAESAFQMKVIMARDALEKKERSTLDLRKRVGKLIANRDCDGAYKLALTEGDFDLAAQTQQLCSDPSPQISN